MRNCTGVVFLVVVAFSPAAAADPITVAIAIPTGVIYSNTAA
jgi:hypothetical protein